MEPYILGSLMSLYAGYCIQKKQYALAGGGIWVAVVMAEICAKKLWGV